MVRIKSVAITGFKSFGNKRTVIKLPPGLVVITGPNGGGKSTVLDAVKFALGELSAHNLRVDRFSKLLHESSKGTDSQALVTLTLDNSDHSIPVDSEEVVISRRLYATGESEYMLNNRIVSRNELLTILSAANIKPDGLNLVTQGSVVGIAEMTSRELREVLEDAAGISGYKKRRDEAHKELEIAQKNIDIAKAATSEVRSRVKQLELERNQLLRKTLSEKILNSLKSLSLINEYNSHAQALKELDARAAELLNKLAEKQAEAEHVRARAAALKNEAEELERRRRELAAEVSKIDRAVLSLETEKSRKIAEKNSAENALKQLDLQRRSLETRVAKWRERQSQLKEEFEKKTQQVENLREQWAFKEAEYNESKKLLEELQKEVDEVENRYAAKVEELRFLKLSDDGKSLLLDNIQKQLTHRQHEKEEAEKKLAETRNILSEKNEQLTRLIESMEQLSQLHETQINTAKNIRRELENSREKIASIDKLIEKTRLLKAAGQQLLETLQTAVKEDRKSSGLRTVREVFGERLSGVHRAVLGDWLNAVYVADAEAGLSLAREAAEKKIPLKIVADSLDLDSLVKALTHGVGFRVVESVKQLQPGDRDVATMDGVYVGDPAIISVAGEMSEAVAAERVNRSMERLEAVEAKLLNAREAFDREAKLAEKRLRETEAEMEETRRQLNIKALEKTRLETELNNLSKSVENSVQRLNQLEEEVSRLVQEKEKLTQLLSDKTDEITALTHLRQMVAEKKQALRRAEEDMRRKSQESSTTYRVYVNAERERDRILIELRNIEESLASSEKEFEQIALRERELAEELEQLRVRIEELDQKIAEASEMKEKMDNELSQLTEALVEKSKEVKQLEQNLSILLNEVSALERENNNLAIERVRIETTLKSIGERLQSFGSGEEAETSLPLELIPHLETEVAEIPVVNQLAAMQYDSIVENYRLRSTRINELEMERKRILDLIESINREEVDAFRRALERVSDSFSFYFNQLTGGEGFLKLENPDDPLNSGVEMLVKFVGKQTRSTVSISGGEKSVSAVALILALQDLTPAQFYIFDEIDAHLDVVYVKNLVNLLKKMSTKKQIIIITLKDIIAEQADALFGVYMVNESSQVVRTRLSEVVEAG
ncbi:MAG: chromosome segregation SMC family protein [Candidatus Caldarchaeum sp.]|jgi:chromosome segregation protein|uniref:Chromosome segregation protein SMC n=3 Tax=Caldiarchaeum subterraneum TaxID=311458 RepID=A0A7J3WBV7_CALS0|nr:chromosome segregation protein SMC [Candidatus Caldarchaeales archaeon]MDJ0271991.1 chromosome segregation protein SMC [Candidatus Caldarchaeales archaeon]